jgi:hypothetical protein
MRRTTAAALLALMAIVGLSSACAAPGGIAPAVTSTPKAALHSGIEGVVMYGPTCPGPVREGDTRCDDKPYQAELVVLDARGAEAARLTSGADGAFRVDLAPGRYTLHPIPGKPFPSAGDQEVVVTAGAYTRVTVRYDSGMR